MGATFLEKVISGPAAQTWAARNGSSAKRMTPLLGCGTLFDGIGMIDPVGGEVGGDVQRFDVSEAHLFQERDRWAEVGAAVERAAAAIEDNLLAVRQLRH